MLLLLYPCTVNQLFLVVANHYLGDTGIQLHMMNAYSYNNSVGYIQYICMWKLKLKLSFINRGA